MSGEHLAAPAEVNGRRAVIIGVHGLANKPPEEVLRNSWEAATREGLARSCGIADADFQFELVYWAKYLYRHALHRDEAFRFDDLYNEEPYAPAPEGALKRHRDGLFDDLRGRALGTIGDAIDVAKRRFGIDRFADWVLGKALKDLAYYYDESSLVRDRDDPTAEPRPTRDALQQDLLTKLRDHADDRVLLVTHSMGTIVAYDALRILGRQDDRFDVPHLVTMGSPLGLPHVKARIETERAQRADGTDDPDPVRTPTVVTGSWTNFSDRRDPVALDMHLADDYGPNDAGVRVRDDLVRNDFSTPDPDDPDSVKQNPHKSFGYCRTPEFSELVASWLGGRL